MTKRDDIVYIWVAVIQRCKNSTKMNHTQTKRYISVRRFFNDLTEIVLRLLLLGSLAALIIFISVSIDHEATRVKIVRDTIYVKSEVEVKGPYKYRQYFDERHPLDLQTSEGTYHFKLINQ